MHEDLAMPYIIEIDQRTKRAGCQAETVGRPSPPGGKPSIAAVALAALLSLWLSPSVSHGTDRAWERQVSSLVWVAYSPSIAGPDRANLANQETIRKDLALLRRAGFTGLVTYSAAGAMGAEVPELARQAGFEGLILGVWDPHSSEELSAVRSVAESPIVLGYCVGNEGLGIRYGQAELADIMDDLRLATGKPVTTTEEIGDYAVDSLLQLGDWVFPNVHPIHDDKVDPQVALRWTVGVYEDLQRRTDRFVFFKEVGLPTFGDAEGRLSEVSQRDYYLGLGSSEVRFVFFEAFDQPWKDHLPFEPHWGLFRADRSPKALARDLLSTEAPILQRGVRTRR